MAIHTVVHDKVARKARHEKTHKIIHIAACRRTIELRGNERFAVQSVRRETRHVLNIITIDLQAVCLTKGHHRFGVAENGDQTNETDVVNARGQTDQNLVGIKLRLRTAP
uniref:Uncharacterized protein n=1 Tax=Noctiluca scintillans TaxID=2966 RepID=A0A7S1AMA0_NOCSC